MCVLRAVSHCLLRGTCDRRYRGSWRSLGSAECDEVEREVVGAQAGGASLVNRATVSALRRTPCDLLAFLSSPEMNAQSRAIGQCFADITDTIETKISAIGAHTSQVPKLDLESSRDLARAMGRISGYQYAEAYEALRVRI